MILVDTSVLISYFRGIKNEGTDKFQYVLDSNILFGINFFIYQEILQGVKTEKEFRIVKSYLDTQKFYNLLAGKESFAKAALIFYKCREKGITVGSTIDCLIAITAIENNLFLLHTDKDFEKIQKVAPLKFFNKF
ncbi:MAG: PIN domain nuclease [Candidatus Omnitrophica bacterium]|nr:PIN domain nuclease [Candidatus Omnitrophota bacterium]